MAPPPNPYKRKPLAVVSPVRLATLPQAPNKKQRLNAHPPNVGKKNANEACLGDDDDEENDKEPRFPFDDADEARKRKGSQPFAGAIAKYSFSLSEQHAGDTNLAKVNTPAATTDTTISAQRNGALSVDFLRVFSTGFHCYDCRIPIGSGYDALCRHMKKFHANTVVANMSKLHAEMVAAKERLSRLHHDEPVTTRAWTRENISFRAGLTRDGSHSGGMRDEMGR